MKCTSQRVWKNGIRYTKNGDVQRYLCRCCGYRFSDPKVKVNVLKESLELPNSVHDLRNLDTINLSTDEVGFKNPALPVGEYVGSHAFTILGKDINNFLPYNRERQVCEFQTEGSRNLAKVQSRIEKRAAGTTKQTAGFKSTIVEYVWHLKKQGYPKTTIETYQSQIKKLYYLSVDLMNPEEVKLALAKQDKWSNAYKMAILSSYDHWCKLFNLEWNKPRYKHQQRLPWIPTEEEIEQLIAGCGKKTATFLQLLKETAIRYREAWLLQWTDVDFKKETINITSAKHEIPRELSP